MVVLKYTNKSKNQNLNKCIVKGKNRGEHAWLITLYIIKYTILTVYTDKL